MENGRINLVKISLAISICPFVIFILSAINQKVPPIHSVFYEIISSLNDYPIKDLSYNNDCNEKYIGTLYVFPGTQTGCSCIHDEVINNNNREMGKDLVNFGECSSFKFQKAFGCIDINPIEKQNIKSWGKSKFCSKKYDTKEFKLNGYLLYLNNSVLENEECKKGYKKCGKLDDFGNFLCIEENEDCPINDIKVTNSTDEELEKRNYSHIIINDDKYLYYTNNSEKPVISKLKVAEEGTLCIDKSNLYTKYPQYILDNNFNNYGCRYIGGKIYDNEIEILDYRTKEILYADSGINLYTKFPTYDYGYTFSSLKANMTLYPHRYIGFDKKCLLENGVFDINNSLFTEGKMNLMNELTSDINFANNFIIWFSIVSAFIELLASVMCNIIVDKFKLRIGIWALINLVIYISMAIPIYINTSKIQKLISFPICAKDIINTRINSYNSNQKTLKITTIISAILVTFQIIFSILIIIIRFMIDIREKREHKYNQPLSLKNYSSEIREGSNDNLNEINNNEENNK
jgi:hypothetical protein